MPDNDLLQVESYGDVIQVDRRTGLSPHARLSDDMLTVEYSEPPTLREWAWDFQRSVIDLWEIRMWRLGYMLLAGEQMFGEDYACVLDGERFHEVTYRKARYVCSRFTRDRVRPGLSFTHHEAVAKFDPPEQDAWLDRAEQGGWTRDELRQRIRESYPYEPPMEQPAWTTPELPDPAELPGGNGSGPEPNYLDDLPDDRAVLVHRRGRCIGVFIPLRLCSEIKLPDYVLPDHVLSDYVARALQCELTIDKSTNM